VPAAGCAERQVIRGQAAARQTRVSTPRHPLSRSGWAVVLRKLRHFQEFGHTAVLIVGDFTAQVGDPERKARPVVGCRDEVLGYAETVLNEFRRVLLPEPLEVRYNSEWLDALDMGELLELTSKATVAQMLERGDFSKRFEARKSDLGDGVSVSTAPGIRLGSGTRRCRAWGIGSAVEPDDGSGRAARIRNGAQLAMTMPLLLGTDGEQKMSQSLGNYIGVARAPNEQFGKTMSIPDDSYRSGSSSPPRCRSARSRR
jgi:tyrosyl-tRNA synthetase